MTKTYELSNERMIMADVDDEHHMATVSVYVLDDLVKEANKEEVLDKIRAEIDELEIYYDNDYFSGNRDAMFKCNEVLQIIGRYM